jgi:DnaJ-class molecular chaperone
MSSRDLYQLLGVEPGASDDTLKKAYRKLARETHPDRVQGAEKEAAEARFKEITAAYETLSDPRSRAEYDAMRQTRSARGGAGGAASPGGWPFSRSTRWSPFGQEGSFGGLGGFAGGIFEDILEGTFGSTPRQASGADTGARGRATATADEPPLLQLTLEEVHAGTSREVTHPRTGKRIRVKIPAGIADGATVRAGDLLVRVEVLEHALFERSEADLRIDLPISFLEAIEGAEIEVPTLSGAVKLKVPPRTQTGRTFRLRGKGLPRPGEDGAGDLYMRAVIVLPQDYDDTALALWKRLDTLHHYDPRSSLRRGT